MENQYCQTIAQELNLRPNQVVAAVELFEQGATVPFIARYRKEATGTLDEVQLTEIRDRLETLVELDKRRQAIIKVIQEQGNMTDDLAKKIAQAPTMTILEDLYLPFKPKRRTKATIAKEKGLQPLADLIFSFQTKDPLAEAAHFVSAEKEVPNPQDAIQGACDIIAEQINETPQVRQIIRQLFENQAVFRTKLIAGKEEEGKKYKDYFDWSEPLQNAPSHRILAMRRAEKEAIISLDIAPDLEDAHAALEQLLIGEKQKHPVAPLIQNTIKDAYKRLIKPSIETEMRLHTKKRADQEAIAVFAQNLRELLLAAPLGQKAVLAVDPGFRTGCKVVCLDKQGKLLDHTAIYPNQPQNQTAQAAKTVRELIEKYDLEVVAIGNGTASRETEQFFKQALKDKKTAVVMVNESGASIYSASEVARQEFADYDLTVRGAVSIGRRLMDPLAELVKIDPKSIGVGQYQHDVDQGALKNSLDDVVMSCVNAVGVEVNTASKELLTYISGLGPVLAQNIINYRNENGPFKSRKELKKIPRLGDKAFEQAAGFLRINHAKNPLDASAVHPERYELVEQIAKDLHTDIATLIKDAEVRNKIDIKKYVSEQVGLPTLQDILSELAKPGRDPREQFEVFSFADGVEKMSDLQIGMRLPGIVTNITDFGAFVDIGVHQDGLVHLSQMADKFIKHPSEVLKVGQKVEVLVTEIDLNRKRIALSMKNGQQEVKSTPKANKSSEKAPPAQSMEQQLAMLKAKFKK